MGSHVALVRHVTCATSYQSRGRVSVQWRQAACRVLCRLHGLAGRVHILDKSFELTGVNLETAMLERPHGLAERIFLNMSFAKTGFNLEEAILDEMISLEKGDLYGKSCSSPQCHHDWHWRPFFTPDLVLDVWRNTAQEEVDCNESDYGPASSLRGYVFSSICKRLCVSNDG